MRRRLLAVSLAVAVPLALTGVASAGHGGFTLTPTSGPAGTRITVSDDEGQCAPPEGAQDPFVVVLLFDEDGEPINGTDTELDASGTFTLTLSVPRATPVGTIDVAVACFEGNDEEEEEFFLFDERTFKVTAAGSTPKPGASPTQPKPSASPTKAKPAPKAPAAKAPATAVKAQPTFTG